ncbi:MAG: dipeptidase [Sporomusaceae bacterium]|jgi:membrane dipeptidase|nr:dipeptidase [Sporomusaceae bacterium]
MAIIDLHCDTFSRLYEAGGSANFKRNNFSVDVEKLQKAEVMAQFFAMFVHAKKHDDPQEQALRLIDLFYRELEANADAVVVARSWQEAEQISAAGKIAAFLTLEEGGVLAGDIGNLDKFYDLGVRLITLTWNFPNAIAFPHGHNGTHGLTAFGCELVEAMYARGVIVDVSHLSDAGFDDVASISRSLKKPFLASHSNARALTPHTRNLTDDMIRTIAECGGVTGLNFADIFLCTPPRSKVEDIIRHIKHLHKVGGIEVIALGSDFDGIEPNHEIENMGQIYKLVAALGAAGFSAAETEKICWQNAARVMAEILK